MHILETILRMHVRIYACRVYLGIDIHKITLSTLVGYHIGYLVDLASFLCLSFLFLFSFSFVYEYAKYVYVHRSALLSSHVFQYRQKKFRPSSMSFLVAAVRRRKENSIRTTDTSCLRFESTRQKIVIDECVDISAKNVKINLYH